MRTDVNVHEWGRGTITLLNEKLRISYSGAKFDCLDQHNVLFSDGSHVDIRHRWTHTKYPTEITLKEQFSDIDILFSHQFRNIKTLRLRDLEADVFVHESDSKLVRIVARAQKSMLEGVDFEKEDKILDISSNRTTDSEMCFSGTGSMCLIGSEISIRPPAGVSIHIWVPKGILIILEGFHGHLIIDRGCRAELIGEVDGKSRVYAQGLNKLSVWILEHGYLLSEYTSGSASVEVSGYGEVELEGCFYSLEVKAKENGKAGVIGEAEDGGFFVDNSGRIQISNDLYKLPQDIKGNGNIVTS